MQTLKTDIKQRILQVAHREFIKNGVQRTCIRNVARKAGVTVGNLYHYFILNVILWFHPLFPACHPKSDILFKCQFDFLLTIVFVLHQFAEKGHPS